MTISSNPPEKEQEIEWNLSEVNRRSVSRGRDELIGEFKIVVADMISIGEGGRL